MLLLLFFNCSYFLLLLLLLLKGKLNEGKPSEGYLEGGGGGDGWKMHTVVSHFFDIQATTVAFSDLRTFARKTSTTHTFATVR